MNTKGTGENCATNLYSFPGLGLGDHLHNVRLFPSIEELAECHSPVIPFTGIWTALEKAECQTQASLPAPACQHQWVPVV